MCSMEIIEISLPTQCVCIYVDKQRMGSDFSSLTNVTIKYSAMLARKTGLSVGAARAIIRFPFATRTWQS